MSAGTSWVRDALLVLAVAAVLLGAFELRQLVRGRRRTLPGYGWETEVTHLLMNAVMAAMMTVFWSSAIARGGAALIAASAGLLVVAPMLRPSPPAGQRMVAAIATVIHVAAALLMAWLLVRMAPTSMHAMVMTRSVAWFEWACAAFFLFDLVSVAIVTVFAERLPRSLRSGAPRLSIVPHVAMDIGMIAMLTLL